MQIGNRTLFWAHYPMLIASLVTNIRASIYLALFVLLFPIERSKLQAQTNGNNEPPSLLVSTSRGDVLGMPIHWGADNAVILQSDGSMQILEQTSIAEHKLLPSPFRPDSRAASRISLAAKLGPRYETMVNGPYVIAAPLGRVERWAGRFSKLLAGYQRYFSVRRWPLRNPDFSLQIIVFASRAEFEQFARNEIGEIPASAIGSYFTRSNLCCLYELPGQDHVDWQETEATIVHEAVHQMAYNTGVHQRLFNNPLWFAEGLATMFEVPTVYGQGRASDTPEARLHPQQLNILQSTLASYDQLELLITQLVASDDMFRSNPRLAYAGSWALTFFLSERMPANYQQLAQRQMARGIGDYATVDRISDFQSAVGISPALLAIKMQRFFESVQSNP